MRVFPKVIVLTSLVAVTLPLERISADSPQKSRLDPGGRGKSSPANNAGPPDAEKAGAELRMSIRTTDSESTDSLRIYVTFENVSDKDTVLNLGMMLANGKVQLPTAVRLILTDSGGHARELHFADARVAGRVDDYAVPLRVGSAYTLKLSLKDYWCPKTKEFRLALKPERYTVRAEFIGNGAQNLNGDTEGLKFMPFWNSELRSDVAQFQIRK